MLKRILEALGALLEDTPVMGRLVNQLQEWGEDQQQARDRIISVLSDVVTSFERGHAVCLIELSRLVTAKTADEYTTMIQKDLQRDNLYQLFKTSEICENIHRLRADLESGFGDIKDSIVLQSIRKFTRALGDFEQYEYSLAERYADYVRQVLLSPADINSDEDLQAARQEIIDLENELTAELRALTAFKRRIFQISLIGRNG